MTPRTESIKKHVAQHFNITVEDLESPSRLRQNARPRHIAMYLLRDLTNMTLVETGQVLGGRDHTTIRFGVDVIDHLCGKDGNTTRAVNVIKKQILIDASFDSFMAKNDKRCPHCNHWIGKE